MLAYDPTTNGTEWIPMQGSAGDLSLAEEASMQELSNIVPRDPSEVPQRMDHFGEQRGESGMEEAMELGYQPGSEGEADSNSMDSPHSPGALHNAPPQDPATTAVSAGQTSACPRAMISTCHGVLGTPPAKLQMRVKGRNSQPSQPPHKMRMTPQRIQPSQGRSQVPPLLEATHLVTAKRK